MKTNETFFKIDFAKGVFLDSIADHLFTALSPGEQINKLKEVFSLAIQSRNDESALAALKALEKVHHAEAMGGSFMVNGQMLSSWVKEVYWLLPDAEKVGTKYNDFHGRHDDVFGATLIKTKMYIISRIIFEWQPEEFTKSSINAFRFLIAAFEPRPKERGRIEGESAHEEKARGRKVFIEEKEGILQMIRKHLMWQRDPECLNFWIKQPAVPKDIQNILIVARARNGGIFLAERDIRYGEILRSLNPDKRSPAALELHEQICSKIAALDAEVEKLKISMEKYDTYKTDVIGASETVIGDIKISYSSLSGIVITVILPKDCSYELGRDIFGRARRHMGKWVETSNSIIFNSDISLTVSGGADDLDLVTGYSKGRFFA